MRCFLGFELTEESRAYLQPIVTGLHRQLAEDAGWPVRLVPAQNWHATLLFFADLTEPERAEVWRSVAALQAQGAWRELSMAWRGLELWPDARRPSLVCLVAPALPAVEQWGLASWLDQPPFTKGEIEHLRDYRPHITVLRLRERKGRRDSGASADQWAQVREGLGAIDVRRIRFDRISLFLSATSRDRPVYPREMTLPLG